MAFMLQWCSTEPGGPVLPVAIRQSPVWSVASGHHTNEFMTPSLERESTADDYYQETSIRPRYANVVNYIDSRDVHQLRRRLGGYLAASLRSGATGLCVYIQVPKRRLF